MKENLKNGFLDLAPSANLSNLSHLSLLIINRVCNKCYSTIKALPIEPLPKKRGSLFSSKEKEPSEKDKMLKLEKEKAEKLKNNNEKK